MDPNPIATIPRYLCAVVETAVFEETQRFRQAWLWLLIGGAFASVLGMLGWMAYQQLLLGHPVGNHPMSDRGLALLVVAVTALDAGILWMLVSASLVVVVDRAAVRVRFRPFHRKDRVFPIEQITGAEAVTYRPIAEYGGWGIRRGRAGWAYNVSGNRGVRLAFKDGTSLLIGSARPDELAGAIAACQRRA